MSTGSPHRQEAREKSAGSRPEAAARHRRCGLRLRKPAGPATNPREAVRETKPRTVRQTQTALIDTAINSEKDAAGPEPGAERWLPAAVEPHAVSTGKGSGQIASPTCRVPRDRPLVPVQPAPLLSFLPLYLAAHPASAAHAPIETPSGTAARSRIHRRLQSPRTGRAPRAGRRRGT